MNGKTKYCLSVLAVFLIIVGTAFALVGDVGDLEVYIPSQERQSATASEYSYSNSQSEEGETGSVRVYTPYQEASSGRSSGQISYQDSYGQSSGLSSATSSLSPTSASYQPPWTGGPVEDQLTADTLGLSRPSPESYVPDGSLNFVSSPLPENIAGSAYSQEDSSMASFEAGSSYSRTTGSSSASWYYPGLVSSPNRLYVQTSSGLSTQAGCSYKGYLPLWADIRSNGYFFIYEWYPGESSSLVRSWGWTGAGYKKGWFTGDVPGWHIISYYCGSWSNYIYIYVYPSMYATAQSSPYSPSSLYSPSHPYSPSSPSSSYLAGEGAAMQASMPTALSSAGQSLLPAGAPVPPDINSEQIVLPDYKLYQPDASQAGSVSYYGGSAIKSAAPVAVATYPAQISQYGELDRKARDQKSGAGTSAKTTTTCTTSTLISEGVYESCPSESEHGHMEKADSKGHDAPRGYTSQRSKAVYPEPSTCRCNEYYVLSCQGDIDTVAGVYSNEWLPLWSKISRPGEYWSYEWKVCHSSGAKGCNPEVSDFGYKKSGWYQTWFKGIEPGWHILSYHCNDWSNYIYIYVWPAD